MEPTENASSTEAVERQYPAEQFGPAPQKTEPPKYSSWTRWRGNQQPPHGVLNNDTSRLPHRRPG